MTATQMNELNLHQSDLNKIESITKFKTNSIIQYYKQFLTIFPNGRISKQKFIDEILFKLIVEEKNKDSIQNEDEIRNEKIKICTRLFDICDQDESGEVDFIEYFTLFWSRAKGNPSEKLSLIFEMYDLNDSKYIDFNELHSIVKTLLKLKKTEESEYSRSGLIFQEDIISNHKLPLSYNISM